MKIITPLVAVGLAAACSAAFATEYGKVVSSTPVTTQVSVPRQQCADQQGYVPAPTSGGGAVVGGVLGGLAGNAVGAGAGRAAATVIGAVAGAVVGNNVEAANTPPVPVTTTNCTYVRTQETRVIGYDVVYEYNGQQHTARLARDPGDQIALDVSPAGAVADATPAVQPVPAPAYPVYPPPAYGPYYPYGPYAYSDGPYGYVGVPVVVGGRFVIGGYGHHFR